MQRTNSFRMLAVGALGLLAAATIPTAVPASPGTTATLDESRAPARNATAERLRVAQAAEAASMAIGNFGFGRRATHYPRPGDTVRQHARKAARRRNQVRARRAARG